MKKIVNKIQNILILIIISLLLIFLTFFIELEPFDELWNFQNIYKMFNGFLIYKDANVIITPLFFYIGKILFYIINPSILTFRIYNTILTVLLFLVTYKILRKLNISKEISFICLSFLFLEVLSLVVCGANYNTLSIIFFLLGVYFYLSDKNSNLIQGLIIFLTFLTKQNVGFFYALAVVIYEFYLYRFSKKFFINQIKKFFTFLILFIPLLFKYFFDGNLINFFDFAFGGMLEFSEKNFRFVTSIYEFTLLLISLILSIVLLCMKKKLINNGMQKSFFDNVTLLFIFSICLSLIIYPIINSAHVILTLPIHLINIFYIFNHLIFNIFFEKEKYNIIYNWITIFVLLISVFRFLVNQIPIIKNSTFISDINHPYFGTFIDNDLLERMYSLQNYISSQNNKGIDVIVCSFDSALFMVPLKQSHCSYDLLFNGNLGYNGIERTKKDILSKKHTEFLIPKNEADLFGQEPLEIRNHIIDNLRKVGEVLNFDIYSN